MSTRDLVERFIATLEARDWDGWVATMTPDVVYELPQSRERIRDETATSSSTRSSRATGT